MTDQPSVLSADELTKALDWLRELAERNFLDSMAVSVEMFSVADRIAATIAERDATIAALTQEAIGYGDVNAALVQSVNELTAQVVVLVEVLQLIIAESNRAKKQFTAMAHTFIERAYIILKDLPASALALIEQVKGLKANQKNAGLV